MSDVCTKEYDVTLESAPKRKVPYWLKPDKMRPEKVGIKTLFLGKQN